MGTLENCIEILIWGTHARGETLVASQTLHDLGVRGSVHHNIIQIKNPTRCNSVSKFYFIFIWSSTCFGQHTAHHLEPKTALAASGFAYVEGCWRCVTRNMLSFI